MKLAEPKGQELTIVSSVLIAAMDDGLIGRNPTHAQILLLGRNQSRRK